MGIVHLVTQSLTPTLSLLAPSFRFYFTAAVGATGGAMNGLGARRRARLLR
jgi:hypothetical protein